MSLAATEIRYLSADPMSSEASFNYDISLERLPEMTSEVHTFSATLSIEKYAKPNSEDMIADFTATYLFGVRATELAGDELDDVGKMFASTTVWSAFSALAALITNQMNVPFPTLPAAPAGVEMKSAEPETSEEA